MSRFRRWRVPLIKGPAPVGVAGRVTPSARGDGYANLILGESGLIGYWRLSEASGSFYDWKNFHHGTADGTVTRGATGLLDTDANAAISLAGTGGVSVTHHAQLNTVGAFSMEYWLDLSAL